MSVFGATYTGKVYNHKIKARAAEWECKKQAEYDRQHRCMLELRLEQQGQKRVIDEAC